MRPRLPTRALAAAAFLLTSTRASAQAPAGGDNGPTTEPAAAAPSERSGIPFPVRFGLGLTPLLGYSPITAGWGAIHTLHNGGWLPIDIAPAVRIWRSIGVELALSAMIPIKDAWGFPGARLAATPAVRVDGSLLYARLGIPFMFGEGTRVGIQAAAGVTFWRPFYVGVAGFGSPADFLVGVGPEIGVRFDDWRIATRPRASE